MIMISRHCLTTMIALLRITTSTRAILAPSVLRPLSISTASSTQLAQSRFLGCSPVSSSMATFLKHWHRPIYRQMSASPENEKETENNDIDVSRKDGLLKSCTPPIMLFGNMLPFVGKMGGLVAGIGALAFGMLGLIYVKQGDILYIPTIDVIGRDNAQNPPGYRSPSEYDIPFETHMIESTDGVAVHSWLLLHPNSKEKQLPTIVFFHGNAGNVGIRVPNAAELYKLEANVLQVEYRGYGESTPEYIKPTEPGIKADAEAAFDFISGHPQIDPSKIIIFGRSLGGAVAFHVADYAEHNNKKLAGIIVENTFESIGHMVDILLPFLSPFKGILLRNKWDSTNLAATLKVPILYIAGNNDEIVPYSQMKELSAKSSKTSIMHRFHCVVGGTHNETWLQGGSAYWTAIKSFLIDAPKK